MEDVFTEEPINLITRTELVKGQPKLIFYIDLEGQLFSITKGLMTMIRCEQEWHQDLKCPRHVINQLRMGDIFTFWQRYPSIEPEYPFHRESEDIAVLPIQSYEHWFNHQIKGRTRSLIRKTQKEIEVRVTSFDEDFVQGMTAIFNEAPVRQGRKFWHYGKDAATVKEQFSRFIHREVMIGAYYQGQMVGFVMLELAERYALIGQILSSLRHRDKAISNLLLAKCVEVCVQKGLPHLIYLFWSEDSLSEFKRRCGFERVSLPRYYVPLSWKGRLALGLGLHRGLKAIVPKDLMVWLKKMRAWSLSRTLESQE